MHGACALSLPPPSITLGGAGDRAVDAFLLGRLPLPLVEELASPSGPARVPVIASRLGALEEKVRDGVSGLLFAPGDVGDLVSVLRRTIDEPDLLARLRAGIPPVTTIADHAAQLEALYAAVRAETGRGGF